jgi:biotin synthase-like enzyme
MQTCTTLGMLTADQSHALANAGHDYYNHNIGTSQEHDREIISTRTLQERLDTLSHVHQAGVSVCCGGFIGIGEARANSVFVGAKLLTADNPTRLHDDDLIARLGMRPMRCSGSVRSGHSMRESGARRCEIALGLLPPWLRSSDAAGKISEIGGARFGV